MGVSTTIGMAIILKDLFTPALDRAAAKLTQIGNSGSVNGKKVSESFRTNREYIEMTADSLRNLKEEVRELGNQKIHLKKSFDEGKISADAYQKELLRIKTEHQRLAAHKFSMSQSLREAKQEAVRLNDELSRIKTFSFGDQARSLLDFRTKAMAMGVVATSTISKPVMQATMELEDARTELENVLMDSNGKVSESFKEIDRIAQELGKDLPGTTADFYKMATTMKALNVSEQSLTSGVLKSSAYLGVTLRGMGVDFNEAATATAKFKESFAIEDDKMLKFIDLIQKTAHTGVKLTEMQYAFSKLGASMKGIDQKGYDVAKALTGPIGLLIGAGISGETVGTGLGNIMSSSILWKTEDKKRDKIKEDYGLEFDFTDKDGKFLGFEHILKELEKVRRIKSDVAKEDIYKNLFGGGEATMMVKALMDKGSKGLQEYQVNLDKQADINQRVENSLKTLTNQWEAFKGTVTQALTLIGGAVAPILKSLTSVLDGAVEKMIAFGNAHPDVSRVLGVLAVGGGVALAALGVLGGALAMLLGGVKFLFKPLGLLAGVFRKTGKAACGLGDCAASGAKKAGVLTRAIGSIGATSKAQLIAIGALSAALVGLFALYVKVGEAGKQAITHKRVTGKSEDVLKEQIEELKDRKRAMNASWYTPSKAWSVLTEGTQTVHKEAEIDRLIKSNQRQLDKVRNSSTTTNHNNFDVKVDVHQPKSADDVAKGIQKAFEQNYFGDRS